MATTKKTNTKKSETKTEKTKSAENKQNLEEVNEVKTETAQTEEVKPVEIEVRRKTKIAFVASEANPFAGTGGLADVIGSLPKALALNPDFDVRVIMPLYGAVSKEWREKFTFEGNYNVALAWRNQYCGLFSYKYQGVTFYFIDNEYYFARNGLYGHYDDGERFAFFSKAAIDTLGYVDFFPDVLHAHDWQAALSVIYLKTLYSDRFRFSEIKTVFTIHNIEYQGKYGTENLQDLFGLPEYCTPYVTYDGCINLMKGAIVYSNHTTTVSPTYSREIKNAYFAHGLEYCTNMYGYKISGILNGIDADLYSAEKDDKIIANYSADDFSGKAKCKKGLQEMLNLPVKDVPILAIISRLVEHKGFDLVKCVMEEILSEDVQFVILGTGDSYYQDYFKYIADKYSGKCRMIAAYNKDLSSKIYSGADIFIMPSKQEPCGLSQMIACRYATIPVVRRTGGLNDSITSFNNGNRIDEGIGFTFDNFNAHEMLYVIKDAIFTYGNKEVWTNLMKRAINTDFSWNKSAGEYERLYKNLK